MIIAIKISLSKIDKQRIYPGEKDKYLDLVLMDRDGQYDDGFVVQQVSKEERLAGVKLEPCGTIKFLAGKPEPKPREPARFRKPEPKTTADDHDDIPF